ncbi:MAG TPA: HD domain-containing protein [Oscillatoriaceae cyanobacterium]
MPTELVLRAAAYAAAAHAPQRRKGHLDEPYINHPLRVAHAASEAGLSDEAIAAALLHDVVEDTPRSQSEIEAAFPPRTAELVRLLTKWWPDDASQEIKAEGQPVYYGAILQDADATALKLLDRADNLRDMVRMLPHKRDWAARYLRKTRREIAPIADECTNALARERYAAAVDALDAALSAPGKPQLSRDR